MKIIERLAALTKPIILVSGFVMLAMLGLIDYVTGPDLSFIVFYLAPIVLVDWFVGSGAGVLVSVAGGVVWFFADILSRSVSYAHPVIPYWNVMVNAAFFLVAGQAMASDRELCQAGYPVMLMTETECQLYLDKRKSLQKRGDLAALQQLDAHLRT